MSTEKKTNSIRVPTQPPNTIKSKENESPSGYPNRSQNKSFTDTSPFILMLFDPAS